MSLLRLTCEVQTYAWGKDAKDSEVAQLSLAAGRPVDVSKPFAELWMGTHPSGPSTLADNGLAGTDLKVLLQQRPELLGAAALQFGADLPFLFKVLSVGTALSIQSHPDKALAERLHREKPEVYKDDNHKPEMALALTEFEALCEFVDHEELVAAFGSVPELRECTGAALADDYVRSAPGAARTAALREAFTVVMESPPGVVQAAVARMVARLEAEAARRPLSDKERLVLRLNAQYPGDVGVLAAWFLNYVRLQPGQAICLAANEPHAYVSGDIVECMATSDNVIRAGLTPKARDTEALCDSLTYSQGPPEVLHGEAVLPHLTCYRPPAGLNIREFEIYAFRPPAGSRVALPPCLGPMLMLVQHGCGSVRGEWGAGRGKTCGTHRGEVWFVGAGTGLEVEPEGEEGMVIWFAACNGLGFMPPSSASGSAAAHSAAGSNNVLPLPPSLRATLHC